MPTTSIGRESCRGRTTGGRTCLAVQYPRPTTGTPGLPIGRQWPNAADGQRAVQDKADALGIEVEALLCGGCNKRLARLIEEGSWTP